MIWYSVRYFIANGNPQSTGTLPYDGTLYITSTLSLILACCFLAYGIMFVSASAKLLPKGTLFSSMICRITLVTAVLCVCFIVQAVLFMYRPLSGNPVSAVWFYLFAYLVPLATPVILQLILMREKGHPKQKQAARESSARNSALAAELLRFSSPTADIKPEHLQAEPQSTTAQQPTFVADSMNASLLADSVNNH